MPIYCSVEYNSSTGDMFVNGPYATMEIAKATIANIAEDRLKVYRADGNDIPWEISANDDGEQVGIWAHNDCDVEWIVHELIPYEN